MTEEEDVQKFPLGQLVVTASAIAVLSESEINAAILRHMSGDWGAIDHEDYAANDRALEVGERLLSVYRSEIGTKYYVITEWDRSATTVLLPEDY